MLRPFTKASPEVIVSSPVINLKTEVFPAPIEAKKAKAFLCLDSEGDLVHSQQGHLLGIDLVYIRQKIHSEEVCNQSSGATCACCTGFWDRSKLSLGLRASNVPRLGLAFSSWLLAPARLVFSPLSLQTENLVL